MNIPQRIYFSRPQGTYFFNYCNWLIDSITIGKGSWKKKFKKIIIIKKKKSLKYIYIQVCNENTI